MLSTQITFFQSLRRYLALNFDSFIASVIIFLLIFLLDKFFNYQDSFDRTFDILEILMLIFLCLITPLPAVISLVICCLAIIMIIAGLGSMGSWLTILLLVSTIIIITIIDSLIHALIVYFFGNSLGKKLFKLKIISVNDLSFTFISLFKRFFQRNLIMIILLILPLLFIGFLITYFSLDYQIILSYLPIIYILTLIVITCFVYLYLNDRKNNTYWDKSAKTIVRY